MARFLYTEEFEAPAGSENEEKRRTEPQKLFDFYTYLQKGPNSPRGMFHIFIYSFLLDIIRKDFYDVEERRGSSMLR